jgi:hypothetical protein
MGILRTMLTTVSPLSGLVVAGASPAVVFDSDKIVWPTLGAMTNAAYSSFDYLNANGSIGLANVKNTVANIKGSFSVVAVG